MTNIFYFNVLFNKIHIFYHASLKMFTYPYRALIGGVYYKMKYCPKSFRLKQIITCDISQKQRDCTLYLVTRSHMRLTFSLWSLFAHFLHFQNIFKSLKYYNILELEFIGNITSVLNSNAYNLWEASKSFIAQYITCP